MNTNLEYYRIFYYVASLGGITAAAEQLCISQPAVSQSVKSLEKQVGGKLFVRGPKGVTLTPEGRVLFDYISQGYELFEKGEMHFKRMTDLCSGEIRIGASDMTLKYYLLPYLEKFHNRYSGIKIVVTNAPTPETVHKLAKGEIDFGVVSTPIPEAQELEIKPVRELEDIFVAGAKYALYKHRTVRYEELEKVPLIALEKNTSTRRYMDEYLASSAVTLKPEFELATSDMIVQFARRNLGVGCIVRDFAQEYIDSGELFELLFERKIPKREVCIITDSRNAMSKAAQKLLQLIDEDS